MGQRSSAFCRSNGRDGRVARPNDQSGVTAFPQNLVIS
jgi:hypothetical protein